MTPGGLPVSFARIPALARNQGRARRRPITPPCPPVGGTYTEIDGGVEGHAPRADRFRIQQRPWSVGEPLPKPGGAAGTQARPVDTYSLHVQPIRCGDGFSALCEKEAQLNALRVLNWLGTITPRTNRVFQAVRAAVKRSLDGFSFCSPAILQDCARDISKASQVSVLHVNTITLERIKCPIAVAKSFWVAA